MLQLCLMPQMQEDSNDFLSQQQYLNIDLSRRWIERAQERDECFMKWPPRSPDLTPSDFFL
jgi:hypothetical protein